jgi:putative phosphoribosyl transferase
MATFPSFQDSGITFADRHEAGEKLASAVQGEQMQHPIPGNLRWIVYALPRGGLPIAAPISKLLNCPLDVVVSKKITRPDNSELAIGAVTADGTVVWGTYGHSRSGTPDAVLEQCGVALNEAQAHAQAQLAELLPVCPNCSPEGAIALIVDDGIATGMTMAAAVKSVRSQNPAEIWICTPLAPADMLPFLHSLGDRVIVLSTPTPFYSVSRFYKKFPQVSIEEAMEYLQQGLSQDNKFSRE